MELGQISVNVPPEPHPPPWEDSFVPCPICGVPINRYGPVLCRVCTEIEAENERAYRDEYEQARRPL
jgi:hypothetical protein